MAWITEQVLADYLNWYPDRMENGQRLRALLDDDVVFTMGTQRYEGVDTVMREFSTMSDAISIKTGFIARPVIGKEMNAENPSQFVRRKAVALCSKVEEYISWLFFIEGNGNNEDLRILKIKAVMGSRYEHSLYYDQYELRHSCKE